MGNAPAISSIVCTPIFILVNATKSENKSMAGKFCFLKNPIISVNAVALCMLGNE